MGWSYKTEERWEKERAGRKEKRGVETDRGRERRIKKVAHGLEIRNFLIRDTNFFHKNNFQFRAKISLTRNFAPPM